MNEDAMKLANLMGKRIERCRLNLFALKGIPEGRIDNETRNSMREIIEADKKAWEEAYALLEASNKA